MQCCIRIKKVHDLFITHTHTHIHTCTHTHTLTHTQRGAIKSPSSTIITIRNFRFSPRCPPSRLLVSSKSPPQPQLLSFTATLTQSGRPLTPPKCHMTVRGYTRTSRDQGGMLRISAAYGRYDPLTPFVRMGCHHLKSL